MRKLPVLFLLFFLATNSVEPAGNPVGVSLVGLIANPEKSDKQFVTVIGFLAVQSEGTLLFLGSEDARHDILPNAIWIEANPQTRVTLREFDGKYVLIVGRFEAPRANASHVYAGRIIDIGKAALWRAGDEQH
jgi:hypothetical protein